MSFVPTMGCCPCAQNTSSNVFFICYLLNYKYKSAKYITTSNNSCSSGWNVQTVYENSLIEHHLGLPPGAMGKITYIAPEGEYSIQVFLLRASSTELNLPFILAFTDWKNI